MQATINGALGAHSNRDHSLAVTARAQPVPATLLGSAAMRIPIGGRIRAGIKILTRRAVENPKAQEIYSRGIAAGKGFESIEADLAKALPDLKNPLVPKNVPYFTARGEDFPNPELARLIMDKFGEDRGEGRHLYRFPVVFPADAWQNVMPHEMVAWTSSERRFWSEYSADGQTRYCKTHEPVPVDGNGRRTIRVFGGRKTILRQDNGGVCEPEACPEYQSRKCNLSGRFIFFIPGIPSISAFDLPTNSFYAMQAAIEKFQTIGFMRGGRISGFLDGKHTPFYLTKRLVEVSRIDEEGRPSRVAQWLIELEAPIDVTTLLRHDDGLELQETRARQAVALLEGRAQAEEQAPERDIDRSGSAPTSEPVDLPAPVDRQEETRQAPVSKPAAQPQPPVSKPPASPTQSAVSSSPVKGKPLSVGDGLKWIFDSAASLGIEAERYEAYAQKRWGRGWKEAPESRRSALSEVSEFADDAEGFQQKVLAELEVWA